MRYIAMIAGYILELIVPRVLFFLTYIETCNTMEKYFIIDKIYFN